MNHPAVLPPGHPGQHTLVIGDVHGCSVELQKLLAAAELSATDQIICVGDLVCKGPDSASVMRWAMETPNLRCVLGNHEARLLARWLVGKSSDKNSSDGETFRQFGDSLDEFMELIKSWPFSLEGEEFLVVHAGLDPRVASLRRQSPRDLMTIRVPEGMNVPWYEVYTQEKLVVFGHWSRPDPVIRPNAIGLDTGCVYGGRLSAVLLPERRLISIPAGRAYCRRDGGAS